MGTDREGKARDIAWPAEDDLDVAVESVETAYKGFLTVDHYRLRVPRFDGSAVTIMRELLERGTNVRILPYDPRTDRVLLIRQFVAGRAPRPLQVIAGMVDDGEDDEAAARREAIEEAACEVRRAIRAHAFLPTPGGSSERIFAFCGGPDFTGAGGVHGAPDEDEDIHVEVFDAAAAISLLDAGRIESAPAVIIVQTAPLSLQAIGIAIRSRFDVQPRKYPLYHPQTGDVRQILMFYIDKNH